MPQTKGAPGIGVLVPLTVVKSLTFGSTRMNVVGLFTARFGIAPALAFVVLSSMKTPRPSLTLPDRFKVVQGMALLADVAPPPLIAPEMPVIGNQTLFDPS